MKWDKLPAPAIPIENADIDFHDFALRIYL